MTDTGHVPGEGLPEDGIGEAGQHPEGQSLGGSSGPGWRPEGGGTPAASAAPAAPAAPAYTFADQPEATDEDDDLLLMPGPQGSWSEPVVVRPQEQPAVVRQHTPAHGSAPAGPPTPAPAPLPVPGPVPVPVAVPAPAPGPGPGLTGPAVGTPAQGTPAQPTATPAPTPVPVAVPEAADQAGATADAHEAGGRDSGSVSLGDVRAPEAEDPAPPVAPPTAEAPVQAAPVQPAPAPAHAPAQQPVAQQQPRRPLHMGPPPPGDATGAVSVRSLADRGPAPTAAAAAQQAGPPTGPEYLDFPRDETAAAPVDPAEAAPQPEVPAAPGSELPQAEMPEPESPAEVVEPAPQKTEAPAEAPAVVMAPAPASPLGVPASRVDSFLVDAPPQLTVPVESVEAAVPQEAAVAEAVAEAAPEPAAEPEPEPEPEPVLVEPEAATDLATEPEPEADVEPEGEAAPTPTPTPVPVLDEAPAPEPAPEPTSAPVPDADEGVAAEGYDEAVREAVHQVIRERRDIRNGFRQDPIPHEVLLRVLEAAHTAPSVGHSQPWDFVVIRSAKTRQKMHELATSQRKAYEASLPKGRAKQFKELKVEAILETPVNIVVTADPTRGGRHTLGRHTQPQMAPYSSALAVENLWLAARAEGLGVGWVSFFDEREMVRELGLPEHLEVVAYLCVGYVDEFPDEPELMQAGWSKRRPLSWVVHEEEYGNRALPGETPHSLLDETLRGIRPLDAKALGEAWERQKRMTKPPGALGMLEIISAQLSGLSRQCPPPVPEPAAVAVFAGDHGVHAQKVTAWPQEVTAQMVLNFLGGGAVVNAFATQVGAEVCVVDVGVAGDLPAATGLLPRKVRPGTADFTVEPAMTRDEVLRAIEVGIETARDLVAAGNKALLTGEMGIANTTVSAAIISVYTGSDPAEVTGRGTGINDEMHAHKVDVVRRALELHQPDPSDPIGVLAAVGGLEHAALVGLLLGGASLRTPVILDGVSAGAAALVARAIAPEVLAACVAGHRSAEPGHVAALTKLGLRPLIDLDLRLGEGTGALLALPVVQSAARAMHDVATFDSAGVTEKS